jgi:hypothetical protein
LAVKSSAPTAGLVTTPSRPLPRPEIPRRDNQARDGQLSVVSQAAKLRDKEHL